MPIAPRLVVLALACALGSASVALAEIYRWTDASGRLHFTEQLEKVPPQHRDAAIRGATVSLPPSRVHTYSGPAARSESTSALSHMSSRDGIVHVPFVRAGTLMRVNVRLNDVLSAPFLVDTGASGISLPSEVAEQLGIRVTGETPTVLVTTAAGRVTRAVVTLDSVELAGARVEDLQATVNPSMEIGLLGGTFFNNFVYRVDAAKSVITLTRNEGIRGGMGEEDWRERFARLQEPLMRLTGYLDAGEVRRRGELERLERRRVELQEQLAALEDEANRLDVPFAWRR